MRGDLELKHEEAAESAFSCSLHFGGGGGGFLQRGQEEGNEAQTLPRGPAISQSKSGGKRTGQVAEMDMQIVCKS